VDGVTVDGGLGAGGEVFYHSPDCTRPGRNTCNLFLEKSILLSVPTWSFLTNHARALICIARDPGVRLRDLAEALSITERRAHGIVANLTEAGYVVKEKDGRRNRYRIETHLPLRESISPERTIGEVLALLVEAATDLAEPVSPTGGRSG